MAIERLSEEIESKNKEIISEIVKNHFSLRDDSFEKFKELLYNRKIAEEFDFVDKENLRFIKEVEVANEGIDKSFNVFNGFFDHLKIGYDDFINNHIAVDKNIIKIQKYILKVLSSDADKFIAFFKRFLRSDLYSPSFCSIIFGDKLYTETGEHKNPIENIDFENIRGIKPSKDNPEDICFKFRKKGTETTIINLIVSKEKMFEYINKEVLKNIVQKIYEKIGESKAPTRKLHLVISLNFADWFLCSTREKWVSCLNLDSEYECCYWKGLPGLIEDKNRCIIYLTDGSIKDYHGIKTYHIIARTWALLMKVNNETKLSIIRSYPNAFNFNALVRDLKFIEPITRNEVYDIVDKGGEVRYPYDFDGLFMDIGEQNRWWVLTIYGDDYGLKYNPETKKFFWDFYSSGAISWFVNKEGEIDDFERVYVCYENGLSTLIEENDELKNYWE